MLWSCDFKLKRSELRMGEHPAASKDPSQVALRGRACYWTPGLCVVNGGTKDGFGRGTKFWLLGLGDLKASLFQELQLADAARDVVNNHGDSLEAAVLG